MYTVLLVDDEHIVLDFLENNIAWQQLGVDTILKASNGQQALELIRAHSVDLLITDIKMPYMDGLTLLKMIRPEYPSIHCILLTAYGEFEYARQALTLGVENYLLKPIQIAELEETVEKALDNLYTSQNNSDTLFRNNILMRWALGTISEEELSERACLLDINIYLPQYRALCLKKKDAACSLTAYRHALISRLSGHCEVYSFRNTKGVYVMLLGGQQPSADQIHDWAQETAKSAGVESAVALALSDGVTDSSMVRIAYQNACALLEQPQNDWPDLAHNDNLTPIIRLALEYIHANFSDNISIKDFCVKTRANMSYLGFLFKKETSVFFNDYLGRYRIRQSILLLKETDLKVGDIAKQVGFSSVSYFIQCFKKQMGISPTQYRAEQIHTYTEKGGGGT